MTKKICMIYTGGTIGMKWSENGYKPVPGFLKEQLSKMVELQHPHMPEYEVIEFENLLDSANMRPGDWYKLGKVIADNYQTYDGFIVLHGTDTMAYTASALPFMLEGLSKPVILTGSQLPLCELRNDAQNNIITSLLIAANYPIPEVGLYFGNKLFRGCRATKIHADGFDAFDSPNYPHLGESGIDIEINWSVVKKPPRNQNLHLRPMKESIVAALRLFPGMSLEVLKNILKPPLQGLVLEAYGVGNGPVEYPGFLDVFKKASEAGVVIVDCSQCIKGRVDLQDYATGSALANAGLISGQDMTTEAALGKLHYLFSRDYTPEVVKIRLIDNMRGELTPLSDS